MEDTHVCPKLFCYSFRIDKDKAPLFQEIDWLTAQTTKYLFRREYGSETNKEHLQGIIWFSKKLLTKDIIKLRNHFRREKGQISFISAKKTKSLASYCNKSQGDLLSNLTDEEFSRIPEWQNVKDDWKNKLHIFLTKLKYTSAYDFPSDFCQEIIKFYLENDKAPPNRNTLFKHLLKYHDQYNAKEYLQDINLFTNYNR